MVCVVGQIFAILLMVQNEDIRDTYKDKGTNGITQPQFIVINTILTFFGGVSVILHALLYNVKGAMDPLQHFVAKLALIGVFLVGFVFLFIYYPFLILSTILALAYAGALIGIVFFSPLGWILIYHVASIVPMIRDRVKENMDNDRDLDEDIIDYTSDTFFYGCVAALATGWAVVFVAFCITVEVAGPFRESNVRLKSMHILFCFIFKRSFVIVCKVCLEYGPLQNITGIILSISAAVGLTKDNVLKWFKKKFCGKKNSDQALCGGFKGHILNCRECGEVIKVRKNKVRYVVCNQDHITDCAPISTTGTTNDNTPPDNL